MKGKSKSKQGKREEVSDELLTVEEYHESLRFRCIKEILKIGNEKISRDRAPGRSINLQAKKIVLNKLMPDLQTSKIDHTVNIGAVRIIHERGKPHDSGSAQKK